MALAGCTLNVVPDDENLQTRLIALERDSWKAWHAQDAKFFEGFLSDDHVELGSGGPGDKKAVVGFIASGACKVQSYAIDDFRFTRLTPDSAMLVYRARQTTTCGGVEVPSPAWATSVFAYRNGSWKNVLYQQLPIR
jgi:hypothetical protein